MKRRDLINNIDICILCLQLRTISYLCFLLYFGYCNFMRSSKFNIKRKLTTKVEVNGMRQKSFAGNTFNERGDRNEVEMDCIRHWRNCQQPFAVASRRCISSSSWTYNSNSLQRKINKINKEGKKDIRQKII